MISFAVAEIKNLCQRAKFTLSIVSAACLVWHLIGLCQNFVFYFNIYVSISSVIRLMIGSVCLSNNLRFFHSLAFVVIETLIAAAAFLCISSNTEDARGFNLLELAASVSGFLFAVFLVETAVTYISILSYQPHPAYSDFEYADFEDE